jgi:hypothetical protein
MACHDWFFFRYVRGKTMNVDINKMLVADNRISRACCCVFNETFIDFFGFIFGIVLMLTTATSVLSVLVSCRIQYMLFILQIHLLLNLTYKLGLLVVTVRYGNSGGGVMD